MLLTLYGSIARITGTGCALVTYHSYDTYNETLGVFGYDAT
jgi:hypothetical protein